MEKIERSALRGFLVALCVGIVACANPAGSSKDPISPGMKTITFHPNGGTGTMEPQTLAEGATAALRANAYTRAGYRYAGWSKIRNAAAVDYADKASFAMGSADVTLYAVWVMDISTATPELNSPFDKTTDVGLVPDIYWIPVDGATSYDFYLSADPTAGTEPLARDLKESPYRPAESLSANTKYYWKVVAKNAFFESLPSVVSSFTTQKPAGFPAPAYIGPAKGSTAYPLGDFAWNPVAGAVNYRFFISTQSDASGNVAWNKGTNTNQDSFSYFYWPGYTWYWKVVAESADASSRDASEVWSFTPKTDGVAAPANIKIDAEYNISWDAVAGAVKYAVLLNYHGTDFTDNSLAKFPTGTTFSAKWLSPGIIIGFTVMAIDGEGNTSYAESVAAAKTFVIQ